MKLAIGTSFLVLMLSTQLIAQNSYVENLQAKFESYRQKNFQEKVFVHTDKSFYLAGEILWFKVYNVDGSFHKPIDLSKVVYVELLDSSYKPALQAKIGMVNASGDGSFFLPTTIHTGTYVLRAYTNWMKNFGSDFFFEKQVKIVNTIRPADNPPARDTNIYSIRFYPEGGSLISGLQSKVGFEILDQNGRGVQNCLGSIVDQNGDTVSRFIPYKFGIGNFNFKPIQGNKYRAIVRFENNTIVVQNLVDAMDQGFVMSTLDSGEKYVRVKVETNFNSSQTAYLFIHTRNKVDNIASITINQGTGYFAVDKNILGEGISHFTIFNSSMIPQCERLYFMRPSTLQIELNADQSEYGLRKKVNLETLVNDGNGQPITSDLSMSVFLVDSLQTYEPDDIVSYLWLRSDLKGFIESPGYYLSGPGDSIKVATDNLMLTHGWRRFIWENVLTKSDVPIEYIPEYEGHIVRARITGKKTNMPTEGILTYISVPGQKQMVGAATSDHNGFLHFNIRNFYGSEEMVIQPAEQKDSANRIDVYNPFFEKYSRSYFPKIKFDRLFEQNLVDKSVSTQVQNAYLSDQLRRFLNPPIDSGSFFGSPDRTYQLDDYVRFTSMEDVLREYVPEVDLRRVHGKLHLRVLKPEKGYFDEDPLTLLDGVPFFNADSIMAFDPLKIRRLDIKTRNYFLGTANIAGIVSFTTYKNDLSGFQLEPGALVVDYEGLQLKREFYSPVYDNDKQTSSRIPDFRNVLYWKPWLETDQSGKVSSTFYTSDQPGKYVAIVQGFSALGKAGYHMISFYVKK
ncbi:MAG: hypothetical protein C5B52_07345 [Bacteroidetes bacterium]|nr:MAG: hypothetical protein C5B52_07345 [Bacteroidota bacterium]